MKCPACYLKEVEALERKLAEVTEHCDILLRTIEIKTTAEVNAGL